MIKKLYSIIFALSLITALPMLGIGDDTYPCDLCGEETSSLTCTKVHNIGVQCTHIFCDKCIVPEQNDHKIWWQCNTCSYFLNKKKKQCWELTDTTSGWDRFTKRSLSPEQVKRECPNRKLLNVTNTTMFPQNPYACNNPLRWLYFTAAVVAYYGLYTLVSS